MNLEKQESEEAENKEFNIFTALGDVDAMREAAPELAAKFLPKARFLWPLIESKIRNLLIEKNCFVIIKPESNGEVSAIFLNKSMVAIKIKDISIYDADKKQMFDENGKTLTCKACTSFKEAIVKNDKGQDMVYNTHKLSELMEGENFENMIRNIDISKMFE